MKYILSLIFKRDIGWILLAITQTILYYLSKIYPQIYNHILCLTNDKVNSLRFLGCTIREGVKIEGEVEIYDPFTLEISENVKIESVKIKGCFLVFFEQGYAGSNIVINTHSFFTKNNIYGGKEIKNNEFNTISLDTEAGIALSHYEDPKKFSEFKKYWDSKQVIKNIFSLFKKNNIKSTWAFCGHLFLENCNGQHAEFKENDQYGPWFINDPGNNYKENSSWYMPDIIEEMTKEKDLIEIAYHSFGHFPYWKIKRETAILDMKQAQLIREKFNLALLSFIFPYGRIKYLDIIIQEGKFKFIRASIGRYNTQGIIVDFGEFIFVNSTLCLTPDNLMFCLINKKRKRTENYYLHPWTWKFSNLNILKKMLKNKKYYKFSEIWKTKK